MTHSCAHKGINVYCPKCGRALPDVCLLKEQKDNGGPSLDEVYEDPSSGLLEASGLDNIVEATPVAKAAKKYTGRRK